MNGSVHAEFAVKIYIAQTVFFKAISLMKKIYATPVSSKTKRNLTSNYRQIPFIAYMRVPGTEINHH